MPGAGRGLVLQTSELSQLKGWEDLIGVVGGEGGVTHSE
jgi:hypothetical protein